MAHLLNLIVCSNFEREVRALSGLPEFRDINFLPLQVECDQVEARWEGLAETLQSYKNEGHPVLLVGSFCLTQAMGQPGLKEACPTAQRSQCVEWIADKDVLDRFLQSEALIVLPGWLKNWEQHVGNLWPGDRKKAQAFFRESAKRIVLLDTGVYPKVESDLKKFARFLKVPHEIYFAGLGHFRMSLAQTLHSWQSKKEQERVEDRMAGLRQQISDYSRIGHLLGGLTRVQTEEETRDEILEVFRVLLSPRKITYHPVLALSQGAPAEDSPRDRILSLNADYAWTEDRSGLLLKIASGREILGILELTGLAFPERRDHDLNLALTMAKIAAVGLIKARAHQALKEEQEKSKAAQAALMDNEEKIRSFEGVPVGLYRTTPSGQILDANAALARILGYPDPASLRKINAWDLHLNQSDRENWQSQLDTSNFVENFEIQLRRRDGTVIWVRDSVRAVKDRRGQILFYDGSIEDISRRKQMDKASAWNLQIKTSLASVSGQLLLPTPIEEMSALVLEHARRLTSSRTCFVGYADRQSGKIIPAALTQDALDLAFGHPEVNGTAHEASGIWRSIINDKKAILTNMPTLDPRYTNLPKWHFPVAQLLAVPALMDGHLVGVIAVANSESLYSEKDLEAVEQMAALYAIAVDRKRKEDELRDLSLTDELTGLHNRRGFFTLADQQLKVANRSKKEMSLLYADLDGLKIINDTFGHDEGDRALVETAALLRDAFRESDIIARIGGDEFVVLTVDAGDMSPDALTWRIQEKFDARNAAGGLQFILSISQGVACYDPEKPCSAQDLVNLADKRMYDMKLAKKAGRPGLPPRRTGPSPSRPS
jgi:diguanylate cyclase (GGDEF)-like protein/PAS domain S-box-containing protein